MSVTPNASETLTREFGRVRDIPNSLASYVLGPFRGYPLEALPVEQVGHAYTRLDAEALFREEVNLGMLAIEVEQFSDDERINNRYAPGVHEYGEHRLKKSITGLAIGTAAAGAYFVMDRVMPDTHWLIRGEAVAATTILTGLATDRAYKSYIKPRVFGAFNILTQWGRQCARQRSGLASITKQAEQQRQTVAWLQAAMAELPPEAIATFNDSNAYWERQAVEGTTDRDREFARRNVLVLDMKDVASLDEARLRLNAMVQGVALATSHELIPVAEQDVALPAGVVNGFRVGEPGRA